MIGYENENPKLKEIKNKLNNCILGFGHFSTVHPGHKISPKCEETGGKLVIALMGISRKKIMSINLVKQEERAEALSLLGIVDIGLIRKR